MSFVWHEHTGGFTGDLVGTSRNPRYLTIPAYTFSALTDYEFTLVTYMTETPYINNTASVVVSVSQQSLVAIIEGGSYQQVNESLFILTFNLTVVVILVWS